MKLTTKITVAAFIAAISIAAASVQAEEKPLNPLRARAEANKEIRNEKYENLRDLKASTSVIIKDMRGEVKGDIKDMRGEFRDDRKEFGSTSMMMRKDLRASTSEMFKKFKDDRKEVMMKMKHDAFKIRKEALVAHLEFVLENLENIADRIETRIEKLDDEGKDTVAAEAKFDVAVDKIAKAKVAVKALADLNETETSTDAEVELTKPREVGDAAIKALKEARDAFKEVIQEIVKLVGKGRLNATTTTTINN